MGRVYLSKRTEEPEENGTARGRKARRYFTETG
jgi:hypothetical protein